MWVKIFDKHTLTLMFRSSKKTEEDRQQRLLSLRSAAGRGPAPERQHINVHSWRPDGLSSERPPATSGQLSFPDNAIAPSFPEWMFALLP